MKILPDGPPGECRHCGEACPEPRISRHHNSVVDKAFVTGGEVPLRLWVLTPIGAEVGATSRMYSLFRDLAILRKCDTRTGEIKISEHKISVAYPFFFFCRFSMIRAFDVLRLSL